MHPIQKIFKKYFLSFLIIFMIPVSFIIVTLFSIGYDIFSKQLSDKDIKTINLSINSFNNELENCVLIADNITQKDNFKNFSLSKSPAEGVRLIKTLFDYLSSNTFIDDAIVYFYDNAYMYSSSTSIPVDLFYSDYVTPNYDASSLKNLLINITEPTFIEPVIYKDTNYFMLAVPLISDYEEIGANLFLFNTDKVNALLSMYPDVIRNFYFLDALDLKSSLQQLDLSYLPSLKQDSFIRSLSTLTKVSDSISLDLDQYVIYACKPTNYAHNLILLSTISHYEIFRPLHILLWIMFISIAAAFILSLVCSYYMAKHNYAPLEEATYSLTLLTRDYDKLQDEVNKNIPIRQYFLLNQLVNGNITNIPDFTGNCKELGIDLSSPYHGIMLVKAQSNPFILDQTILETIKSMQQMNMLHHYLIQHIHPNIDIYLIGAHSDITLSTLSVPEATLYFGSFSQRLSHIPKSYIDARTISELQKPGQEFPDPAGILFEDYKASLTQLNAYLQMKDFSHISSLIFKTMDSLESNDLPFPLQKVIGTEMIMLFNNYIDRQDGLIPYDKLDLVSLFKVESFDALKEIVLEVSTEMLDLIINYHHSLILEPSITLIKDLLHNHFDEESLSAEQIALHFNVTPSYLDDYFYKQTKISLIDYVTKLRLEKAELLLKTTPYSLKIIASQVGFSHVSSFISLFKEHFNCTPGQYRSKYYS